MAEERRTATLQIRLTPTEKAELERRAAAADVKPSEYVRLRCCATGAHGESASNEEPKPEPAAQPQRIDRETDTDPDRMAQFDRAFNQFRRRMGPTVARVAARKEVYGW